LVSNWCARPLPICFYINTRGGYVCSPQLSQEVRTFHSRRRLLQSRIGHKTTLSLNKPHLCCRGGTDFRRILGRSCPQQQATPSHFPLRIPLYPLSTPPRSNRKVVRKKNTPGLINKRQGRIFDNRDGPWLQISQRGIIKIR
ncbi:unnamed protein product, partial [Ectocarpus sp. 12 AP-2014]